MKRPRSGIIGAGFMGSVHARAVRAAGGVLSAVAASSRERAAAMADAMGAGRAADSAAALIESDDVDLVHICTPNDLHASLGQQALAAGKHVICEKPLATSVEAAGDLVDAAASAGVVATVPFIYRFYPSIRAARGRVRRAETGRLHLIHGSYLQDWLSAATDDNWRVDQTRGGPSRAFADIGIHWADLVEFVSGHRITRLCARTTTVYARGGGPARTTLAGTEDAAAVLFETDGGAVGTLLASQVSPGRKNRLWFSLDGTGESISFDQEQPDVLRVGTRAGTRILPRSGPGSGAPADPWNLLPPGHPQGYQDAFTAFVASTYAAIGGAARDELPAFSDGLRAARLTAAVLQSAASGDWQAVG
jgi:predicted dehydrogenase